MSLSPPKIKIFLMLTIGLIVMTMGYYNNRWGAVETTFYEDWQNVFEPPVIGRLAKSARDGILSAGGLLGLVNFDVPPGENPSVQIWMAPRKVIEYQYDAYLDQEPFQTYATYDSAPGAQGVILGALDRISPFPPNVNLKLFRGSAALLTALVLSLLFLWFGREFGPLSTGLCLLFAPFSLWLTLLAGNLYWNLWAFFLPLVAVLFLTEKYSKADPFKAGSLFVLLFVTALTKVLFNGFEFVTTAWVMISVPLIYYAVLDHWKWMDFLKRMASLVGILSLVTAVGLLILASQVASVEGGYANAATIILDALSRRSIGDPSKYNGIFQEALDAKFSTVLWNYLHFPTLHLPGVEINHSILSAVAHLEYWVWFSVFAVFSVLLLILLIKRPDVQLRKKGLALLTATWYSSLAPLSWLVFFKAHAYIHVRLAPVIWQMPFLFFGIALVGFVISNIRPPQKTAQPVTG